MSFFRSSGADGQTIVSTSISGAPFQYIVTILMENNGYCDVMTTCGGTGSYETSLAQTYSIAGSCQSDSSCSSGGYTAISHPSEPNYVSLTGGDTFGISSDGNCCWQISSQNIVDRVEAAGLSWQAWAEDASGSGTCSFRPPRAADHFAFLEFKDMNTTARCTHFLSTTSPSDTEFLSALDSASPANYIWLTPNDNDNGHATGVSGGDSYLSGLVPSILNSNLFKTQRAALFIVYDEGNSNYPTDYIYASWSGPAVKIGYTGTGSYSHYSFLKTLETAWGLQSLTANDASAPNMSEFFNSNGVGPPPPPSSPPSVDLWTLSAVVIAGVTGAVALIMVRARRKRGDREEDEDLDVSLPRRRRSDEEEEE